MKFPIPTVIGFLARWLRPARHFFLAAGEAPGRVRFLSTAIELAAGEKSKWVTVTRTGTFSDPRYGKFDITPVMLAQMVKNFDAGVLGQDVFLDVNHKPGDGAAARVQKLAVEGNRLRALVEWTDYGVEAVTKRGFAYLSAEFHENWRDNEQGNAHGCVLLGAGLTVRPVIKHLDRVALSEGDDDDDDARLAIHPTLLSALENDMNKHLIALRTKLLAQGLTEEQIKPIIAAAEKQLAAHPDDEAKCLAMVDTFNAAGEVLTAQLKTLAATGTVPGAITLQVGAPGMTAADVSKEVQRILAEQAAAAAADATTLAGKVRILSDMVTAAEGLSADTQALLLSEIEPLVTKELSDDQVKSLAAFAIKQASSSSAAAQLATLGFRPPSGSVHITVESGNQIKSLQEQVDRRLGITRMAAATRYARTGGTLLAHNKDFAERCLAEFDAVHGARLMAEHKMLAAGSGSISDTSVPTVFERTVIREALYNMQGLSYVDMGTAPFANTINIPYSYRDTSGAGPDQIRIYERQGIPLAGVIQTSEEARPLPQKLAFNVANEMQYLLQASPIDFDPLADNVANIIRITGEDTDKLVHNEILRSSDEAQVGALNDTLTAQVNGTNKIFVTTQFPVVRPRKVYDLKGVQQGATQNPLVVTLNAVARAEYTGGTLAAGLYYIADYNLGEFRFVNELGVLQTPTNGWVLTIVGSYTQNVAKFNLDVGANPDTIADVYDRALTMIGSRKVVIENDRYYNANMLLMSGAVDNALSQAKSFQANSSRLGTGLSPDGSVGYVKNIPNFNTKTPGLFMQDTRILLGERANTRFRMLKAFQMTPLTEARNSNGLFVAAKEGYGEQYIAVHTPSMRKNANTSLVLYSATGRVARVS